VGRQARQDGRHRRGQAPSLPTVGPAYRPVGAPHVSRAQAALRDPALLKGLKSRLKSGKAKAEEDAGARGTSMATMTTSAAFAVSAGANGNSHARPARHAHANAHAAGSGSRTRMAPPSRRSAAVAMAARTPPADARTTTAATAQARPAGTRRKSGCQASREGCASGTEVSSTKPRTVSPRMIWSSAPGLRLSRLHQSRG
jgi:hypothetical protein